MTGSRIKQTALELLSGDRMIAMKVNGKTSLNTGKALIDFQTETCTMGTLKTVFQTGKEFISGTIRQSTQATSGQA